MLLTLPFAMTLQYKTSNKSSLPEWNQHQKKRISTEISHLVWESLSSDWEQQQQEHDKTLKYYFYDFSQTVKNK